MVGRDAGIVRIQTMCVNSVDDSLVPVSTSQLSHGRPHIHTSTAQLLVSTNSALQADDFYTFLVTTGQTTADVRFRTPAFTPDGTYFLKICEDQHQFASSSALWRHFYSSRLYAFSALEAFNGIYNVYFLTFNFDSHSHLYSDLTPLTDDHGFDLA